MSYGPYVRLPPGRFGAEFALSVDIPNEPTDEPLLYIDATIEDPDTGLVGTILLARKILHYQDVARQQLPIWSIEFELDQIAHHAEFRVYTHGNTTVRYHAVTLTAEGSILRVRYGNGKQ